MSSFKAGDRVQIVGEAACRFSSTIAVILAEEDEDEGRKFVVRLTDGTESVFSEAELTIPPAVFADIIFDSDISPVPGVRGTAPSTSVRQMRYVCREFDVHIKLAGGEENRRLFGQISAAEVIPATSLVTLLLEGKPYASTTTDVFGEFDLQGVPRENTLLEIVLPFQRIIVPLERLSS